MEGAERLRSAFSIQHHRLLNNLATGLSDSIGNEVPEIKLKLTSKTEKNNEIKMAAIASVTLVDTASKEEIEKKVNQIMDALKNPSNLMKLLGG